MPNVVGKRPGWNYADQREIESRTGKDCFCDRKWVIRLSLDAAKKRRKRFESPGIPSEIVPGITLVNDD